MSKKRFAGERIEPFTVTTIRKEQRTLPAKTDALWHLQFRRFAGCPVCNFHLRSFARELDRIRNANIHELVFFHSDAAELLVHQDQLPFDVVGDPEKEWYRHFGVSKSVRAVLDPRAWAAGVRGLASALGDPATANGGRLGLPADFLIDGDGTIVAVKYGAHADDQWSIEELLAHAEARRAK